MFDPATEQIKEWKLPTEWSAPYDVVPTKGATEVWTGSMLTDQVARLNPKTDEIVEYLLPHTTNIRRVFVARRADRSRCCGSATTTATRSSRSSRSTDVIGSRLAQKQHLVGQDCRALPRPQRGATAAFARCRIRDTLVGKQPFCSDLVAAGR